jgi:hypothetical protein
MSFRRQFSPVTLFRIAMSFLLVTNLLPWLAHPTSTAGVDWLDGVRGLMLALGIGFVYLFFRARRISTSK